ncbi:MAG TPA: protein kinase, partial [Candidatus Bathyarchaeia archaeon]|nr:protein kinase [Candidatus Bathyarchaeia archaeon]
MIQPGDKIQRYELIRLLGKGGMGEVYLARDAVLERNVALKFLPDELEGDPRMRERFLREAKSAAALDHPFICKIFETGSHQGKGFIAMEYIEGETLKDRMGKERIPLREAIRIALETGEALENAHKAGIVHRDLKPANLMLSAQGHIKVMDFGLAKHILPGADVSGMTRTMTQNSLTEQGAIAGTIAYMSPEQARGGALDGRSDIFSLGIILYEMLTGGNPFAKDSPVETLTSILRDPAPPTHITPRSVNPLLNPIVQKALAKDPAARYNKIGELVADLDKAYRQAGGGGRVRFVVPRRALVAAGAVLAVAAAAFLGVKLIRRPAGPSGPSLTQTVSVLIADAVNKTGDPVFDGVLEQLLAFSLGSAEHVSVFERKQAAALIRKLDPASDGHLTSDRALLLARREGVNAVIDASIEAGKTGYLAKARAVDPVSAKILAETEQTVRDKKDVLKVPDLLAAKLKAGLGVISESSSEALIEETFTTNSLEAMKAYADAQALDELGKEEEAIAAYLRAIENDPDFGRAYAGLAVTYYARGEMQLADKYFKEAMGRIDQMTEREKHRTRGAYYLSKSNFKRAVEEYGALVSEFPKDVAGHTNLALSYFMGYRMPEAFAEGAKACEIEPDNMDNRYNQGWYALAAGDFEQAKIEAGKTLQLEKSYPKALVVKALADIALGRLDEAAKDYGEARPMGALGVSLEAAGLADLALYQGKAAEAATILTSGAALDETNRSSYRAADKMLMLAEARLSQGKAQDAVKAAERAVSLSDREEILY